MGKVLKYKHLFAGIAAASIVLAAAIPAHAFIPGPFGGPIIFTRPGNNCLVLSLGPPRGGEYIFVYGASLLFSFFALRPGAWVLGLSGAPYVCFLGKVPIGAGPAILIVGTSY